MILIRVETFEKTQLCVSLFLGPKANIDRLRFKLNKKILKSGDLI